MSEKRFQKTRIVDKWGGIYDSETDRVLSVNDVEHKLNEQQAIIQSLKEENEQLKSARRDDAKEFSALFRQNFGLKRENEQLKKGGKE